MNIMNMNYDEGEEGVKACVKEVPGATVCQPIYELFFAPPRSLLVEIALVFRPFNSPHSCGKGIYHKGIHV